MNVFGLSAFCVMAAWVGVHVVSFQVGAIELAVGVFTARVVTDFACGMIHWAGDTWGRTNTPVIGRMFVRTFREHHVDPRAITRHGTVQLLGEQAIVGAPLMPLLWLYEPESAYGATLLVFMYAVLVVAMAANVFHRWAHMTRPPLVGRVMQRAGLIISFKQHAKHHRPPYVQHYCIAIGWLNPLLDGIRFWRGLEWLIYKCTGAVPREDDLGHEAALALMLERAN
jgi:ubiquitin-conjugating enzyme E2 variant